MAAFPTDMVSCIIPYIFGHGFFVLGVDAFQMYGCIDLVVRDVLHRPVAAYENLQLVHVDIFLRIGPVDVSSVSICWANLIA